MPAVPTPRRGYSRSTGGGRQAECVFPNSFGGQVEVSRCAMDERLNSPDGSIPPRGLGQGEGTGGHTSNG
jgi:hypothetical protein